MRKVTVIGAGFAGLTVAHHLQKRGFDVTIHERAEQAGGLIGTVKTEHGQAETAANALLADKNVEDLFVDCGIEFAERSNARKKRFIFWDKPQRWPLSWRTSWLMARRAYAFMVRGDQSLWPEEEESVHDWAVRAVNREFAERLIEPALQGIYAGDPSTMSASLIIKGMGHNRPERGYYRGSIAPAGGMGALIKGMQDNLQAGGAHFQFNSVFKMPEYVTSPIVIATSAWHAAEVLHSTHPEPARILQQCESVSLVRVTCHFQKSREDLDAFGCLFPAGERFHSLGVLFDSAIFPGSAKMRTESWILGGAAHPAITAWSDDQVIESIVQDRRRLMGSNERPVSFHIVRWGRAIPHYTVEWESALKSLHIPPPVYLHGNYLGQIGLARILKRSMELADTIKENYG